MQHGWDLTLVNYMILPLLKIVFGLKAFLTEGSGGGQGREGPNSQCAVPALISRPHKTEGSSGGLCGSLRCHWDKKQVRRRRPRKAHSPHLMVNVYHRKTQRGFLTWV